MNPNFPNKVMESQTLQIKNQEYKNTLQRNKFVQMRQNNQFLQNTQQNQFIKTQNNQRNALNNNLQYHNNVASDHYHIELSHGTQKNSQRVPPQFMKKEELQPAQKRALYRITTGISVFLELEQANHPTGQSHLNNFSMNLTQTHLRGMTFSDLMTREDLISLVSEQQLCPDGQEENFVDYLIEVCSPQQNIQEEDHVKMNPSLKHLYYEFQVEENFDIFEKISGMLHTLIHGVPVLSDEQKKRLLDALKEKDAKQYVKEFEYDWVKIATV